MKKLAIILIFLNILNASAQNHLEPIPDFLTNTEGNISYKASLKKYLYSGLSENIISRVIVAPSFTPEYIVSVESEKDENFIFFRTFEKMIYRNEDLIEKGLVKKIEHKRKITKELADLFREILFEATTKTRYPPNEYFFTSKGQKVLKTKHYLDGETYYFVSSLNNVLRAGTTHSAAYGTIAGDMEILTELMKLTSSDKKIESELHEFAKRLLIKIKTS